MSHLVLDRHLSRVRAEVSGGRSEFWKRFLPPPVPGVITEETLTENVRDVGERTTSTTGTP
jgi:hypothetical protein